MSVAITGIVSATLQMRQAQLAQETQISIMKKTQDQQVVMMDKMLDTLQIQNPPHLGNRIDILA